MAVFGVGIDLVKLDRIGRMLDRYGPRFESRVFTSTEAEYCASRKTRVSCLAMRFAAKEAFVKALGTGMRAPVLWLDIEVTSDELGKPVITLSEKAQRFCSDKGICSWHLSMTDDGDYGAALVVIETDP